MTPGQQKVLAIHALFHQGQYPKGSNINLVESNSNNDVWVTEQFTKTYGWGNGQAWCAQTCSVVGMLAGVMDKADGSAGAWALTDHLAGLPGGHLSVPEPGAVVSIQEGSGHVFTALEDLGGGNWRCGEGNWGDRYQWTVRNLSNTAIHSIARYPGIAAEMNHPAPAPAPAGHKWSFATRERDTFDSLARILSGSDNNAQADHLWRLNPAVLSGGQRLPEGKLTTYLDPGQTFVCDYPATIPNPNR